MSGALLSKEIYEELELTEKVIIYGTGIIAAKCFNQLQLKGYLNKVICFTETTKSLKDTFCGLPILEYHELTLNWNLESCFFLIAVGNNKFYEEIEENIFKSGNISYADGRKIIFDSMDCSENELKKRQENVRNYLLKESCLKQNGEKIVASHVTYPYIGNAGDTFLSYCVRHFLNWDSWNIINVADTVNEKIIDSINETDVLIIGGGGLFLPDTNKNLISGWQWAITNELLKKINVPVYVFSVGYNYFKGQHASELFIDSVQKLVEKAEFVGLRNKGSVEAIQNFLPERLRHKVIYQPCTTSFSYEYLANASKINKSVNTRIVAINMAFDRSERRFGVNKIAICREVAKAIKMIEDQGFSIVFVAHCDEDFEFLVYLEEIGVNYRKLNLSYRLPDEIMKFYKKCHIVIGMRGHAQMIPFGLNRNIITLGTHNKMRWFLEDIDFMDLYVDLTNVDEIQEGILNIFNYINRNLDILQKRRECVLKELHNISIVNKGMMEQKLREGE